MPAATKAKSGKRWSVTGAGVAVRESPLARARRLEREYGKHYFVYQGEKVLTEREAAEIARRLMKRWAMTGERSERSLKADLARTGKVPRNLDTWIKHKGRRYDIPGVDTKASKEKLRRWGLEARRVKLEIHRTGDGYTITVKGRGPMPSPDFTGIHPNYRPGMGVSKWTLIYRAKTLKEAKKLLKELVKKIKKSPLKLKPVVKKP